MKFIAASLSGAYRIEFDKHSDERGFFARTFCVAEFERHNLCARFVQHGMSFNPHQGTVRGLHFQSEPHAEVKIVSCTRGKIWDVILDARRTSPTFGKWEAFELSPVGVSALYIGKGLVHGFQTLSPDSEVHYMLSEAHAPESSRGVLWDDPEIGIRWPLPVSRISQRDLSWPPLARLEEAMR